MNEMARMLITEPGRVRDMPAAHYHADPCPTPSLSSHIANTLLRESPRHAWRDHPRLNPRHKPVNKKEFDLGTLAHGLMLGEPAKNIKIVQAKDWKTQKARLERKLAYTEGRTPVLPHQADQIVEMVTAGQLQIQKSESPDIFSDGLPEQSLFWLEETRYGPIWCRARLDWFPRTSRIFADYKTTGGSASSDAFYGQAWDNGYNLQAAFYMRGIRKVCDITPLEFKFVFQEVDDPYALTINAPMPECVAEAELCVEEAIDLWGWCLKNNSWPGYSGRTAYYGVPPWVERRREERKERHHMLEVEGKDPKAVMMDWQRPL